MATFEQWILAAAPHYPVKAIGRPFEICPLAGKEKYNRYLFGCEYKLGSVGATKKKWHLAHRYRTLNKAFFDACRHYWCVRRAIVRWRERRMQERGSGMTLEGDPLSGLPSRMLVRLVDGRTKHTFYIRDLLRHMRTRLFNSDYFIPDPLAPTNPLTGMVLSESNQMRIYMTALCPAVNVPMHQVLKTYWRVGMNLSGLMHYDQVLLHEMAIVNEPDQAGPEMLHDLADMYSEAGLDVVLVPSIAEANAINAIDLLIQTHVQAFRSYYLMTRSWCEYMSQTAKNNLPEHCAAALVAYSTMTLGRRRHFRIERSEPSLLAASEEPPAESPAQPPLLEPEAYESEDDASPIIAWPEDLELVRRPAAAAAAGPAPEEDDRPPTPLVSPEEYIDTPRTPSSRAAEESAEMRHNAVVADLMAEFQAILNSHDTNEEERQEAPRVDMGGLERYSRWSRLAYRADIDDDLVEKVTAFTDEHMRPLSLAARAAIARRAQAMQQQAEAEADPGSA
jgi:hypothetical protein